MAAERVAGVIGLIVVSRLQFANGNATRMKVLVHDGILKSERLVLPVLHAGVLNLRR